MSKKRRNRKLSGAYSFLTIMCILFMIFGSGYLIYQISLLNNIENNLRLIGSIILGVLCFILLIVSLRIKKRGKRGKLFLVLVFMLLIGGISLFGGYNVDKVYRTLSKVSDTSGYKTYSSSIVTLATSSASSIKDIKDEAIGILSDKESLEGYIIPKEVIKEEKLNNETKEYSTFIEMIDALYKGDINYVFLPTNYSVMYGSMEGYTDIKDKTKIIYSKKKKVKEKSTASKGKSITEPFTVLIMGVDSEEEGIKGSSFNGDSLMLITFNPKTLNTTILSIPRDSYVPIACFAGKRKNKITHAAWKGEECMMDTIKNLLDVDIDYYVKINFRGAVELVDTLGGVDIDVPYALCEQDSYRRWGYNTVYIEKGMQTLDGEKALAYSRNRHPNPEMCSSKWTNYNSSDFIRGQHQQEVVAAILNKIKTIKNLDTVYKLLDTISNNMVTNMSTDQILSLYNVFKDVSAHTDNETNMADVLGFNRLQLNGYDTRIVDYGGTNLSLYNYVLYKASVKEVSDAMKENLGIKKGKDIKTFSFNINTPYEKEVIGAKTTDNTTIVQVPNFVGQLVSVATSWGSKNGINITVNGGNGYVLSQNVPAGANVEDVKSITVTSGGSTNDTKKTETKESESKATTKKTEKEEPSGKKEDDPALDNTGIKNDSKSDETNDNSSKEKSDSENEDN